MIVPNATLRASRRFGFRCSALKPIGVGAFYGRAMTERRGPHALAEVSWMMSFGFFPDNGETAVMILLSAVTATATYTAVPRPVAPALANAMSNGADLPLGEMHGVAMLDTYVPHGQTAVLVGPFTDSMSGPGIQ